MWKYFSSYPVTSTRRLLCNHKRKMYLHNSFRTKFTLETCRSYFSTTFANVRTCDNSFEQFSKHSTSTSFVEHYKRINYSLLSSLNFVTIRGRSLTLKRQLSGGGNVDSREWNEINANREATRQVQLILDWNIYQERRYWTIFIIGRKYFIYS
jgi:hypothetical protein